MSDLNIGTQFSAEHHALLFAWMVREIIGRAGEKAAAPAIGEAVRRYGRQRGARMAMRAEGNGHERTMMNYLVYGEWKAGKEEMKTTIVEKKPRVKVKIPRCPWHTAWKDHDLMKYGRYYCLDIDKAVLEGYNPALRLEVNEIKPDGAAECDMVFHELRLTPFEMMKFLYRKLVRPGGSALMPWEYHTGHIYRTVGDVFIEFFKDKGREARTAALGAFAARYGEDSAGIVRGYEHFDFDRLPKHE
jgi:hypothetical protein